MAKSTFSLWFLFIISFVLVHAAMSASPSQTHMLNFLQMAQDPCDLCDEVTTDRAQIARLQGRVAELEQQIAVLQRQTNDCQTTVDQLQDQVSSFQLTQQSLQSQQSLHEQTDQLWLNLCPDLGQTIRYMRTTARAYLEETYSYLQMDLPILFLMEVIKEKNLYCLGMGNSFLQLRQSVLQAPVSLWNLSQEDVQDNVDYQWTLTQANQVLQAMRTFVAIDPDDCEERLDSYLADVLEYYNNMNERMRENMQAWLSTYQSQLQLAVDGMPYCANISYDDFGELLAYERVPS